VKPQRVCCKLRETIEQPCSDVIAHTPEVCKGARLYNGYLASKNDHDSWAMCTTSAKCKTIITAVLTVMSSMDPNMISETWDGFLVESWVRLCRSGLLDGGSVMVRLCDALEAVTSFRPTSHYVRDMYFV
jgi:hypothetical protein